MVKQLRQLQRYFGLVVVTASQSLVRTYTIGYNVNSFHQLFHQLFYFKNGNMFLCAFDNSISNIPASMINESSQRLQTQS